MTVQEKRMMTARCMNLVRANYHLLKGEGVRRSADIRHRRRLHALMKWLTVIEDVYARLRRRDGKSTARARHDWLVARTIELMVFADSGAKKISTHLAGPRPLNERYVEGMTEAAVRAVAEAAEEAGLLHDWA